MTEFGAVDLNALRSVSICVRRSAPRTLRGSKAAGLGLDRGSASSDSDRRRPIDLQERAIPMTTEPTLNSSPDW